MLCSKNFPLFSIYIVEINKKLYDSNMPLSCTQEGNNVASFCIDLGLAETLSLWTEENLNSIKVEGQSRENIQVYSL